MYTRDGSFSCRLPLEGFLKLLDGSLVIDQRNTNLTEWDLLLVRPVRDRVLGGDNGLRLGVRLYGAGETIHGRRLFGGRVGRVVIHVASEQHELFLGLRDLDGERLEGAAKHCLDADGDLAAGIEALREVDAVEFGISESSKKVNYIIKDFKKTLRVDQQFKHTNM